MSKKGAALSKDVPWRAGVKPVPKIHHSRVLRVAETPFSSYAISIMKHPDPIGSGLAAGAVVEPAGPDCIVPGQTPVKLLGLQVWPIPIEVNLKFLEPIDKELKNLAKCMDSATVLMNKSFSDETE